MVAVQTELEDNMDKNTEDKSFIYIEFEDMGSAEIVGYNPQNVTPLQLLALASFLEFEGKSNLSMQRAAQLQAQMQKEQMGKIAIPKPNTKLP